MYSLKKEFKFECSHRLHNLTYDSPCKNIHGHSYRVFVELETSDLDDNGMVIDFTKLKTFQKWLDRDFDHVLVISKDDTELINIMKKYLPTNDITIFPYNMTTAENMAECFAREIDSVFNDKINNIKFIKVTVYETVKNSASYILTN